MTGLPQTSWAAVECPAYVTLLFVEKDDEGIPLERAKPPNRAVSKPSSAGNLLVSDIMYLTRLQECCIVQNLKPNNGSYIPVLYRTLNLTMVGIYLYCTEP